jgi:hypothetical protein
MYTADNNRASLALSFVVVGGGKSATRSSARIRKPAQPIIISFVLTIHLSGIGGFSVAYALAKAGHKVRVLERQLGLGTPAAGLRVPPNMSKILCRWIGEEELRKHAVVNLETPWYDRV